MPTQTDRTGGTCAAAKWDWQAGGQTCAKGGYSDGLAVTYVGSAPSLLCVSAAKTSSLDSTSRVVLLQAPAKTNVERLGPSHRRLVASSGFRLQSRVRGFGSHARDAACCGRGAASPPDSSIGFPTDVLRSQNSSGACTFGRRVSAF